MYIRELLINSFGKYENKRIEFKRGFNVVYGENEAGKSTVHKFIEAMFFGFYKDMKSRRIYSDDYKRYLPLNVNSYKGALIYSDGNRDIRIERNLLKGNDKVQIFDEGSGEDITKQFYYDSATKLYSPLDPSVINRRIFNNTVSIQQLGSSTSKELADELKEKLVNFRDAGGDMSVKSVLNNLKSDLDSIGTPKRKGTPLWQINKSLEERKDERDRILDSLIEVEELKKNVEDLEYKIKELKGKRELNLMSINAAESATCKKRLEEYSEELEKLRRIEQEIKQLEYIEVSVKDADVIENCSRKIELLEAQVKDALSKIQECEAQLRSVEVNGEGENVQRDDMRVSSLLSQKDELLDQKVNKDMGSISEDLKKLEGRLKLNGVLTAISVLLALVGLAAGFLFNPLMYLLCTSSIIAGALYLSRKKMSERYEEVKRQFDVRQKEVNEIEDSLYNMERELKTVLEKYGCKDVGEFKAVVRDKLKEEEDKKKRLISMEERKKGLRESLLSYTEQINENKAKIDSLLKANGVSSVDEYIDNLNNLKKHRQLKDKLKTAEKIIDSIISPDELEYVKSKANEYPNLKKYLTGESEGELKERQKKLDELINDLKIKKSNLEGRIENLTGMNDKLSDVESDISYSLKKLEKLESRKRSIELAMEVIHKVSDEIRNELAPELNSLVSDIIGEITEKYNVVKVAKDLDIKVEDPISGQILEMNKLSSGTIDQVYFSFRMGLNGLLNKVDFPLLLDETFVQYDDNRLSNVLSYLAKKSDDFQIILFTSQLREIQYLQGLNEDINVIHLKDEAANALA